MAQNCARAQPVSREQDSQVPALSEVRRLVRIFLAASIMVPCSSNSTCARASGRFEIGPVLSGKSSMRMKKRVRSRSRRTTTSFPSDGPERVWQSYGLRFHKRTEGALSRLHA